MTDSTAGAAGARGEPEPAILLVEDDERLATVIASVMSARGHLTRIAPTAHAALRWLAQADASVVVIDLGLPDMDGLELLATIRRRRPELRVMVLSISDRPAHIVAALRAGASGYLIKEDAGADLVNAIDEVLAGGSPLSRTAACAIVSHLRTARVAEDASRSESEALTAREGEVLQMLARGLTYDEVAEVMRISTNTVRTHVRAIYDKLDAASRTEAVMAAVERGLVTVSTRGAG